MPRADFPIEPPSDASARGAGRPTRITLWSTGLCCVAFAAVDLLQSREGGPTLRTDSFLEAAGPFLPWVILSYGVILIIRANRSRTRRSIPALAIAITVTATLLAAMTIGRTPRIPDETIVQQGSYPELCPGLTIQELLARSHSRVDWIAYFNKYGYRSVQAACFDDDGDEPSAVLVWSIDDDRRFLLQFAMQDGASVDPYGLVARLCRAVGDTPKTRDGG